MATEKAIAAAALGPEELKIRFAVPATPLAPLPGPTSGAPLQGLPPAAIPPGGINPLTGLRVPTPEAAAAFLASHPQPAASNTAPSIPDVPPTSGATPPPSVPEKTRNAPASKGVGRKTSNPETILVVIGSILAVLIGGGLMAAYLLLRQPAKRPPIEPAENAEEGAPSPDSGAITDAATTSPTPGQTGGPAPTPPDSSPATPPSPDDASEVPSSEVETPLEVTPAPPAPEPGPPPPPPRRINNPDPAILAWVHKIELTGIRSGTVPKVFMNGKLYEVGETVNYDLGVKLVTVAGKVLTFEDGNGNTYEYRF